MPRSCLQPLLALALAGLPAATAHAAPAPRSTVLIMGNVAGFQTVAVEADGALRVAFEFNDRGRGPKLDSRIVLGPGWIPTSIETTGNDYMKSAVDERFSTGPDGATWKNGAESGSLADAGQAFYLSLDGTPLEGGLLAQALLAARERRLPLLPAGEAALATAGPLEVTAGGRTRTVVLHEIENLAFTPSPVWLTPEGDFFAYVSEWFTLIDEGWEEVAPALLARQQETAAARRRAAAERLAQKSPAGLAIRGARLFDAETATLAPGRTVLVQGDRIVAVGPDGEAAIPPGARLIDAGGKTLLPGLWDMHVHVGDDDGPLHIANGVTSVRDLANDNDVVARLRRAWDEGTAIGPRLAVAAGFMDGPGPYAGPTKVLVDTIEEAEAAVDTYADLGYPQVKVYSSIRPELVPAIVARAHARGLAVSGHIPAFMTARQAVEAGYDEIQHVNMLFLNFWPDVGETRTPARFTAVAERGADLDLASPEVADFIALLKREDVVVDPTLATFEAIFLQRPGELRPGSESVADRLPPQVRRGLLTGGLPVPEGMDERYRASYARMVEMVGLLHRSGIRLVAGTDELPGFTLHRELELWVEAGIPAPEILRIATLGAARVAGRDAELGSIAPGKLADLILVPGDPTTDISTLRDVETVIRGGVLYDARAVAGTVGVR